MLHPSDRFKWVLHRGLYRDAERFGYVDITGLVSRERMQEALHIDSATFDALLEWFIAYATKLGKTITVYQEVSVSAYDTVDPTYMTPDTWLLFSAFYHNVSAKKIPG